MLSLIQSQINAKQALKRFEQSLANAKRKKKGEAPIETLSIRLRRYLSIILPCMKQKPYAPPENFYQRLFTAGTLANDTIRMTVTFLLCQLIGILIYIVIAIKYAEFPANAAKWAATGMVLLFEPIRCIFYLSVPSLLTVQLKRIIVLFIMIWTFQGPTMNAENNVRTVVESAACVELKLRDMAEDLRQEANRNIGEVMADPLREIRRMTDEIHALLRSMRDAVAQVSELFREHFAFIMIRNIDCNSFMLTPYHSCTQFVDTSLRKCHRNMVAFLCRPLNALFPVCEMSRMLNSLCDVPGMIRRALEEGALSYVKTGINAAVDKVNNAFDFSIEYTGEFYSRTNTTTDIAQLKRQLRDELAGYQLVIYYVTIAMEWIFAALLALPFVQAIIYRRNFLTNEAVDNIYVTSELAAIDERRAAVNKVTVLPLMRKERKNFISVFTLAKTRRESFSVYISILLLVLGAVLPVMVFAIDNAIYQIVFMEYTFFGPSQEVFEFFDLPSHYRPIIVGNGIVADLMRRLFELFQPVRESLNSRADWRKCIKQPSPPNYQLANLFVLFYIICIVLIIVKVYIMRIRHLIAESFYPDRRLPRALHLYQHILRGRSQLLRVLDETVPEIDIETNHMLKRMPWLGIGNDQCHRCSKSTDITAIPETQICINCRTLYCYDCYIARRICRQCGETLKSVNEHVDEPELRDSSCEETSSSESDQEEEVGCN